MRQSVPRIRSVKRKSDGYKIDVITRNDNPHRSDVGQDLINSAINLSTQGDGTPVHGYIIVTWDETGRRENAYCMESQYPVSPQLLPQFVAEGLKNGLKADGYIDEF